MTLHDSIRELLWLFGGVLALLVVASTIGALLAARGRGATPARADGRQP